MPKGKNQKPKKTCVSCGKSKTVDTSFYLSNSEFHKSDGRFPSCKECVGAQIDYNDISTIENILIQMNRPFLESIWISSKAESEKTNKDWFGVYYKNIILNFKHLTWKDSVFIKNKKENSESIIVQENELKIISTPDLEFEVTPEIIGFWGAGYTKEQYRKLQEFKEDMERSYEIETASHKDYLKKICMVSLKMDEAVANDNIEHFKKLSDAYDKLMHSAKFTAVQRSASDRTGGMNTFGEFFEYIEKEGFIPRFHTDEPQDIVDKTIENIMKYTKRLVLGDPNIGSIVEATLNKMKNNELDDEENEVYEDIVEDDVDFVIDEEVDEYGES